MSLPSEIKGAWIYSEVVPQLVPEINFANLLRLGTIVKHKNRIGNYQSLRASLRKIQWTKIAGTRAIAIEKDIAKLQKEPNTAILDPLGITDHSLCITDCLIHTKSALDSMAVFLNDLLELNAKGAKRDLKLEPFRQQIAGKDHVIGDVVRELSPWIDDLQDLRDEWIHRTTVEDIILIGPSKIGILPLPKKAHVKIRESMQLNSDKFWSTSNFVKYHYDQFVLLFNTVVDRARLIEGHDLDKVPEPNPEEFGLMALFPVRVTKNMVLKKIKLSIPSLSGYYHRLSELFKATEVEANRIDGSHFEFLTNLSEGLWNYTCAHFGFPANMPVIRVIFVEENKFRQFSSDKLSGMSIERKASAMHRGFLDAEGKQEGYFIMLQKSRLRIAREYFMRHLRKSQNTSEIILRLLIHEITLIYEEVTHKKYVDEAQALLTDDEANIYSKFKNEHPEYFTEQSNKNMQKTLKKILS